MAKFRIYGQPTDAVSEREQANRQLAREAAAEGMVLLKNEGVLPMRDKRIALFGVGARKTFKGGAGSGEVHERYSVTIEHGLKNAGYELSGENWMARYDAYFEREKALWKESVEAKIKGFAPWNVVKMFDVIHVNPFRWPTCISVLPEDLDDCETAVYVLARQAGEGDDRRLAKGDWYLDDTEITNIRLLAGHYKKLLLVINCGGMLDLSPLDEIENIGAILHFVQGGEEGGNAFADIVSGKVTPSGKLTDTWAMQYEDYPCAMEFGSLDSQPDRADYKEGIHVGYRWFDALCVKPRYPFGYGLSYTRFESKADNVKADGTCITVGVTVDNLGAEYGGKEVVQLYIAKPDGKLQKERRSLAAFAKTKLLAPGESESLVLRFDLRDCASYDEETASWMLERGEYGLFLGTEPVAVIELDGTAATEKVTNICPCSENFEEYSAEPYAYEYLDDITRLKMAASSITTRVAEYKDPAVQKEQMQHCLDTFTEDELIELCVGGGYAPNVYNIAAGVAGKTSVKLRHRGIPNVNMADGPSGLNIMPKNAYTKTGSPCYVDELPLDWQWGWLKNFQRFVLAKPGKGLRAFNYATAFPVPTLQAQTWNTDLVERIGKAIGTEMLEMGVTFWLAPGLNIHRNPLCGRNFEYYSEDPLLSGRMAAAVTRGVQSCDGVGVCLKHVCCNNQEDRREYMTSNVHERALREIYLRGFGIAIREGKPWTIMSSYNMVNGVYTANSHDLLTKVLRCEFGFDGLVMSDWNATEDDKGDHEKCLTAGNDLIMPGSRAARKAIKAGLQKGAISAEDLKRSAANILNKLLKSTVITGDKSL